MLILVESSADCCNDRSIFMINTEVMIHWYDKLMGNDGYGYEKTTCIFCGCSYAKGSIGKIIKIISEDQNILRLVKGTLDCII